MVRVRAGKADRERRAEMRNIMSDNTNRIPLRSEVAEEYTWNLQDLYVSDEAWKKELDALKERLPELERLRGRLGADSGELLAYFRLSDEIELVLDRLANYAMRKADEDTRNAENLAKKGQITALYVELGGAVSYAEPEILSIPEDTLQKFLKEEPGLAVYRRAIYDIRRKKAHILSDAEERILAAAGELQNAPGEINGLLLNADMSFPDITDADGNVLHVTSGSFIPLMHHPDKNVRRAAFTSLYSTYDKTKNTSAALLSAQMKQLQFEADMRRYDSALEAALDQTQVDLCVYRNLIDTVHANMASMYKYVRLRRKLLKLDELNMYDLYVPMTADADKKISFEEAKENVLNAMSVLGEDYVALLKEGFANRWIDVYENAGKRSGAYSAGCRVHPYVLLNHQDNLDSEFTLAHEMGHALHSYLSNKNQPVVDSDYVIFVAEVASTCNEALLMQYLLGKTTDKRERAYLINYFLEQFRGTLYRQTMFAEFELKMSEMNAAGESINADSASRVYHELIDLYFGDGVTHDELIDLEWARIPHFYYNFYVYQYATGFSAAIALSQKILKEGAPAVEAYKKNFLSAGCSKDPVSILKDAGVDMSTGKPIADALKLFDSLLDEMEELTASL